MQTTINGGMQLSLGGLAVLVRRQPIAPTAEETVSRAQ